MKEIIKEEPVYVTTTTQTGTKQKKYYVTDDGRDFDSFLQARQHEAKLKLRNIKYKTDRSDITFVAPCVDIWYYPSNQEEVDIILQALDKNEYTYIEINGNIKPGEWIGYADGEPGEIYTLTYIKELIMTYFNEFGEESKD
jgi:hypothetical protein